MSASRRAQAAAALPLALRRWLLSTLPWASSAAVRPEWPWWGRFVGLGATAVAPVALGLALDAGSPALAPVVVVLAYVLLVTTAAARVLGQPSASPAG